MPRKMRFSKTAKRPKDIDVILPGLGVGEGRNKDRFRVSSETYDEKAFNGRMQMVRDLANRMLFPVLRARLDGRVSTGELYRAWRSGESALKELVENHRGKPLAGLLDDYLAESAARGKEKYRAQIERYIEHLGGTVRATTDHFTSATVASFLATLANQTRKDAAAVTESTKNRYRAALQGFASWMIRRGHISTHPIAFKAVPKRPESRPRLPEFTASDYRRYFEALAHLATTDPWFVVRAELLPSFGLALRVLIHTGGDVSEVLSRRVADLSGIQTRRIKYRRTKTNTPERLVPLPPFLAEELDKHVASARLKPTDDLFPGISPADLATGHERVRLAIGRDDLRLKDFRHVAAIAWRRAGVDLMVIRDWLGHATVNQTMIYAAYRADDAEDREAAERAAARLLVEVPVLSLRAS